MYQLGDTTPTPSTTPVATSGGSPSWVNSLLQLATGGLTVYEQAQAQKQLNTLNTQSAAQGLPPLTPDQAGIAPPTAQVSVGLSSDVQKLLMYGGVGLLGFLVLSSVLKRRGV